MNIQRNKDKEEIYLQEQQQEAFETKFDFLYLEQQFFIFGATIGNHETTTSCNNGNGDSYKYKYYNQQQQLNTNKNIIGRRKTKTISYRSKNLIKWIAWWQWLCK